MKKEERIQIRVSEEKKKKIELEAQKKDMSVSAYMIQCWEQVKDTDIDRKNPKKVLKAVVDMQNAVNELKREKQVTEENINQLEQGVKKVWQFFM